MQMSRIVIEIFYCICLALCGGCYLIVMPCVAQIPMLAVETPKVTAKLVADTEAVYPGVPFKLKVMLTIPSGWHIYYKVSGEAGMPTSIDWTLPSGFKSGELEWQKPKRFMDSGIETFGYTGNTTIACTITPSKYIPQSTKLTFAAKIKWLACKDLCVPGGQNLSLILPVSRLPLDHLPSFWLVLLWALIGGFILNLMPCVLPVISIKVLEFVEQAGHNPRQVLKLGLAFALGIISSFVALACIVIAIQSTGEKIGWGFQFQQPTFVIGMAVIVLLLAMSLFGLFFVLPLPGQSVLDRAAQSEGYVGTFCKGVLATTLSTPCTAPFLGTAVGFAFVQPAWVILVVFLVIGLGMSLPYLCLAIQPAWLRFMPKPGAWLDKFKTSLGFLLLATVVWLLHILGSQLGFQQVIPALAFLLLIAFAAWFVSSFTDLTSSWTRRLLIWIVALLIVSAGYCLSVASLPGLPHWQTSAFKPVGMKGLDWQPFTMRRLNEALDSGQIVFVDFTAEWCLTCKVNEKAVIDTHPVIDRLRHLNVLTLKADWTKQDSQITQILHKYGRSGVPLYLIFVPGQSEPIILPEIITQPILLDALVKAESR